MDDQFFASVDRLVPPAIAAGGKHLTEGLLFGFAPFHLIVETSGHPLRERVTREFLRTAHRVVNDGRIGNGVVGFTSDA